MKKVTLILIFTIVSVTGCNSLRFAPTEEQKQNAWLHNRTVLKAAETAKAENASNQLQTLTNLSELQSRAFTSYFGLPEKFPPAESVDELLSQSNYQLVTTALQQSSQRPDAFELADNVLEIGIGIFALLGGVYGTRAASFLKTAKQKSQALKEIIAGNELFKQQNPQTSADFKMAHKNQSHATRQLVAELKT